MKVLQINSVCGIGSTGRIVADLHDSLIKHGHDSFVAYGCKKPVKCDKTIKIGSSYSLYKHAIITRLFDWHGFGSKKETISFIEVIKTIKPDIIHLHNIHGYYVNVAVLFNFLKSLNIPIVWTLHDCWVFTGHCTYFDYIGCNKWKDLCSKCPQKREYPKSMLFDQSKRNYLRKKQLFSEIQNLTFVTPSIWMSDLLSCSFLKHYPVRVINNGIDLNVFSYRESQQKIDMNIENKFVILGVASQWEKRKGFKHFLDLSNLLNYDEVIIMVGLSKNQINNLPNNVIGVSHTNSVDELAELYSIADVFFNPTLEDNFPTTNLEALACGTPVITFNTGGSIESIDRNTGHVVEKGDIAQVKCLIGEIKHNGKSFYHQKCIDRASSFYCKSKMINEYLDLYQNRTKTS